ncbi:motility associated factor glycosyltransferase family protein [bacterium]|nr:motility associated factor glycosyltransferase family protein [bacterium]
MFENNLKELQKINPDLCDRLKKLHNESLDESISVGQAESGEFILLKGDFPLDDLKSPSKASQNIISRTILSELRKSDFILIYGLGMGYLLDEVFLKYDSKIIIYEPDINVLRFVFENVDLVKYLSDNRVFIFNDEKECLKYISGHFISGDKMEITYPANYALFYQQVMPEFIQQIYNILKRNIIDTNTTKKLSELWTKNIIMNSRKANNKILFSQLENKFKGTTAMILGAGPSLKENIKKIKENREKFTIFAVNRTLEYLQQENIVPDFAVFTDSTIVKSTTEKLENDYIKQLNIIADIKASSFIFDFDCKNLIVYLPNNEPLIGLIAEKQNLKLQETYGTAAAVCLYCAKEIGAKEIICAGIDLAFKGDELYSDGKGKCDGNQVTVDNYSVRMTEVKSKDGEMVKTREDYLSFIPQFEKVIEGLNKKVKVYNITSFGAYIKGMEYKTLEEIIPEKSACDTDKILASITPQVVDYATTIDEEWVKSENIADEINKKKEYVNLGDLIKNVMESKLLYATCQYEILELGKKGFTFENVTDFKNFMNDLCDRLRKVYYELD